MFLKNNAGRDAVWEAEQRGSEELVGWLLSYGEEKPVGDVAEGQEEEVNVDESVVIGRTENNPEEQAETKNAEPATHDTQI